MMDIMEAIRVRRSVREYDTKPIPEPMMAKMKDALRLAPSACNFQPWKFILVTDAGLRAELVAAANNQKWMSNAPVIIVGVGFPETAYKHMGGAGSSVDIDLAIALDHLTLAAASEGLGTCWIGAFRETEVKQLLHIPTGAKVVALTPLGYPAKPGLLHPVDQAKRKQPDDLFCTDRFA